MADQNDIYKKFGIKSPEPFSVNLSVHVGEEHGEIRLIIKHHLQKLGFKNIRVHRDGCEVLSALQYEPVDVALEGDDLLRLNGYDILKELTEDTQALRPAFVIISKPLNKSEAMFALEKGVDDILVRPITTGDLFPRIKSAYENFTNPKNPERLYEYAKAKIRENDLDQAYNVYSDLSVASEKAARPLVGLAKVNMLREKYEEAVRFVTNGIERNENYIHAYSLRGEILCKMNNFDGALKDFRKAVQLSPLNVVRYAQCSEILIKQAKFGECIDILNVGHDAGLIDPFIIERTGYCYFMMKDYSLALKFLKEAVRLAPTDNSFANSLAICYRDSNELEKAIATYNQILKRTPDNHLVLFNKAVTLILAEKKEEAIKILRRIIKIDPKYTKAQDKLRELGASLAPGE